MTAPAGWYPDPAGSGALRFWDATAWTDHLRSPEQVPPPPPAGPPQPLPVPPAEQPLGQLDVMFRPGHYCEGSNGEVEFDGEFVTIHRGLRGRVSVGKGTKRIPLASIIAVQWKPADSLAQGFIQFTVPGGNELRSRFGSQTASARHDENSVTFPQRRQQAFEELRNAIESAIMQRHRSSGSPAPNLGPGTSIAAELYKLSELHDAGALTDDEFSAAKARLLGL